MPPKPRPRLPTPAPENIATREYYHATPTDAPDADIEYPASQPASPQHGSVVADTDTPHDHDDDDDDDNDYDDYDDNDNDNAAAVQTRDIDDIVTVSYTLARTPSPSPSEIVLSSELADVGALSRADGAMRARGVARGQRKEVLLELREGMVGERARQAEGAERRRVEGVEREYEEEVQRRG